MTHVSTRYWGIFLLMFCLLARGVPLSAKENHHFLWKIETEQNQVYFLGSVHILSADQYPLNPVIENAFEAADIVVFETHLDSLESPEVQLHLLQKSVYGADENLKTALSDETYAKVTSVVERFGLPMAQFNTFRPWFLAMTFTVLEAQRLGLVPEYGIDRYFFTKAKQAGKTIEALESIDFQLALFTELPPAEQELFLKYTLADLDVMSNQLDTMISAWQTGNTVLMDSLVTESVRRYPEIKPFYQKLDDERNQRWIPQIEAYLQQDKNVLIIVGALHLSGEGSVIDLLRQKGYQIEQL
ncbi:MAG: TraB/GumN family protein [Gemmatimonadetes bacterium]|nr:MAG: TraB/GumN family protein [Gemmatimonadota bacterium]